MNQDLTQTFELVRRAQAGDGDALNRIMERYANRVRRIVRLRLGSRLRTLLESGDIVQDTMLAAVQRFDRFEMRDEASLINWLAKLAERQITDKADYHRAAKRDPRREVSAGSGGTDDEQSPLIELPDNVTQPVDRIGTTEEQQRIESCLEDMPERYRELIILRDYAGYSWKQVADETGRASENAARMMYAKALVELGKRVRKSVSHEA